MGRAAMHLLPGLFLLLAIPAQAAGPAPGKDALQRAQARLAPVDLGVDLAVLSPGERTTLSKLVEASRIMDALFLRQVWPGNGPLLLSLLDDPTPLGRARLELFHTFKGPWDRIDNDRPFLPGVPPKPAQAGFYPADATRAEVERWANHLPNDAREDALGFYTVVKRRPDRSLLAVPYAEEYRPELSAAAALLLEAASSTADRSLQAFLTARARAFETNAYRPSDVAWMRVDGPIEATIGPYETDEDGWFDAKAAFEAVVGMKNEAATVELGRLSSELQRIEDALPVEPSLRGRHLGEVAPIRVVDVIFMAGDAEEGVLTAAYNLPNDEWVQRTMGSKRVLLENVQRAKFQQVLLPIAKVALSPADRRRVAFEPFFTHTLMHELMHGLGPILARAPGRPASTVRAALGEDGSALEEAKADVGGLFALERLLEEGKLDRSLAHGLYQTFVADGLRSVRFGLNEAHGKSSALQLAWYLDHGAIAARPDGTLSVDAEGMKAAVTGLLHEILTVQGRGDKAGARALLAKGTLRPEVKRLLARLTEVPVDIHPRWVTAEALASQ